MKEKTSKLSYYIVAILCLIGTIMLVIFTERVTESIRESVNTCLNVIIPSLFSFMVLSLFMLRTGYADSISSPLMRLLGKKFKYGKEIFPIFILSLIGGYPIGVRLLKDYAYNNNYNETVSKALTFCYCGSPAYIITIIGVQLYGSVKAGVIIYISNVISSITIAVFMNIRLKTAVSLPPVIKEKSGLFNTLVGCVKDSVSSIAVICGMIIFVNIVLLTVDFLPFTKGVEWIKAFGEISNSNGISPANVSLLPFFSMLTSLGGICILVQTSALSNGTLKMKYLLISRIPAAAISAAVTYILINVFPNVAEASAFSGKLKPVFSEFSPICSICLIIMTYILLKKQEKM